MNIAELQKTLRAADEAAVLVSSRILEKVIREAYRLPNLRFNIPHWKSYVCDRHQLFKHAEQADLEVEPDQLLPDTVILLVRPEDEETSTLEKKVLLLKYWRMLFHSRVHLALDSKNLTEEEVRRRIETIGRTEFEEIRNVLIGDRYLPTTADERATYIEFAAVFLELRYFAAGLLRHYFPGVVDFAAVEQLLCRDVDAAGLFASTRLRDAPDPVMPTDTRSDESLEAYWKYVRSAQSATLEGNIVRAAILQVRASRVAPAAETITARKEAEKNIAQLTVRFAQALHLDEAQTADWTRHLTLLLDKADQGARPTEARVLEDVQKVCLDEERQVFTLDLVEYVMSGGKRPIKRPLPSQKLVRIASHLRAALQKMGELRLADSDRNHLSKLFETALHDVVERQRARFAPVLTTALEDVGLAPTNPIEQAAFDKMIGELLDHISRFGYLTFAELRDTISRNQLKLADVTEPDQFIRGDPLIRLDRRLGALLDGVYRPGDFYVRWLEQGTSLLFGTWWGRPMCLFFLLPFGVAWLTLQLLGMFLLGGVRYTVGYERAPVLTWVGEVLHGPYQEATLPFHLAWHLGALAASTVFFVALFQLAWFRQRMYRVLIAHWLALRWVFWDVPLKFVPLDTIHRFLGSWLFRLVYWYLLRPAAVCLLLYPAAGWLFHPWFRGVMTYAVVTYLTTSPVGVAATEKVLDAFINLARLIRAGLLPGLIRFILHLFKQIVEAIEYATFVVDEWLRFRAGDSKASLVARTVLALAWFPIAFFIRLYMVVLVEPMVNPVKLPLSILFAKFVYPLLTVLGLFTLDPLGSPLVGDVSPPLPWAVAWVMVVGTFYLLPDAVTFLFWEMKENWRLYRANRSETLRPTVVGTHGETVRGLLQPGFHSGTVPHVFARLRQAERQAARTRNWHTARAYRHEVEEIARVLRNFLDREMLALVRQSRSWQGVPLSAGAVHVSTNRIHFEVQHPGYPGQNVGIDIEHHHDWVLAGIHSTGWLDRLTPEQLRVFTAALAGLYKRADVDLVREQLLAAVSRPPFAAKLTEEGLIVWNEPASPPTSVPLQDDLDHPEREPLLDQLVFGRVPITWRQWVECWTKDQDGQGHPGLPGLAEHLVRLSPAREEPGTPGPTENGQQTDGQTAAGAVSSRELNVGLPGPDPQE